MRRGPIAMPCSIPEKPSHKTDYFGREQVKRLSPYKCPKCKRVVAGERTKLIAQAGANTVRVCLGCANGKTPSWGGYVKTGRPLNGARSGSLL